MKKKNQDRLDVILIICLALGIVYLMASYFTDPVSDFVSRISKVGGYTFIIYILMSLIPGAINRINSNKSKKKEKKN